MTPTRLASTLFISYNGLTEPLGRSQVLAYVEGLSGRGWKVEVLSFEKSLKGSSDDVAIAERLGRHGIPWHRLHYHHHPRTVSTLVDVLLGLRQTLRRVRGGVRLVHARSHVPALIAEVARTLTGVPYLFDHRGLLADEYADAGIWRPGGLPYRAVQRCEQRFLEKAAGVVVLSERYRQELAIGERCVTIPCGVDLRAYRPGAREDPAYDLVYAGSWSGLYLSAEMVRFFEAVRRRRSGARLLLLVPVSQKAPASQLGIEVKQLDPEDVPKLLRRARAGLSFRRPGEAQKAASPVKVSEYLATGLPAISSAGVGDLDDILESTRTGIIVRDFSSEGLEDAADRLLELLQDPGVTLRCRQVAEKHFDVEEAIASYSHMYGRALRTAPTTS